MEAGAEESLIRNLASCNKTTRDRALRLLNTWLPAQSEIGEDDMKKLWKGLFYCVWHADKPPVQSDLIKDLASLLLSLPTSVALHYFTVFLLTMRREWAGIDALRLDKFYLLIRRFLHYMYLFLKKNSWDLGLLDLSMGVLEDNAFLVDHKLQGNGVNYHIASIFLEELQPFLPLTVQALEHIFNPSLSVMGKSEDRVLVGKFKTNVFDVLMTTGRNLLQRRKSGENCEDGLELLGAIALDMGFSQKFYAMASSTSSLQANKKTLFGLHEEFLRLERDVESMGLLTVSINEFMDDGKDQGTSVLENGVEVDTRTKKPSGSEKKTKKMKKKKKKKKGDDEEEEEVCGGDLSDTVIANLQKQFEKVASESVEGEVSKVETRSATSKKRKRLMKNWNVVDSGLTEICGKEEDTGTDNGGKKVRFAMKNNLVWKPHNPLPPQSLRLPPSATPRGSALKKGLSPGPIMEIIPVAGKRGKQKGRKGVKSVSPAMKRLRKLRTMSV